MVHVRYRRGRDGVGGVRHAVRHADPRAPWTDPAESCPQFPLEACQDRTGIQGITFSSDGRYLATASADHSARVWDTASGREVARLFHEGSVKAVVFSPDDRYVTTASTDHAARVWETRNGMEMARLTHERPVWTAAFSANGRYLATQSADHAHACVAMAAGGSGCRSMCPS